MQIRFTTLNDKLKDEIELWSIKTQGMEAIAGTTTEILSEKNPAKLWAIRRCLGGNLDIDSVNKFHFVKKCIINKCFINLII